MAILIRCAKPADAAAVADVYLASRKAFLPFAPLAHGDAEVRTWIAATLLPAGGVSVAEVDGRVVGMVAVSTAPEGAWIDQLYVAPDSVDHGVGTLLLRNALGRLSHPVRLYTFAENLRARAFYERHGFTAIDFGDGSGNEEGQPDVLYELDAIDQ
ncbi:MAG: GNAT family N-acetyltransferase [Pseudomonadales bacterium]